MKKEHNKIGRGFTLVEILVYVAIFAVSATFLVAILGVVLKVQNKQSSATEVNQQISFVNSVIQRLIQESSLVENQTETPSPTLTLRMPQPSEDPTEIYWRDTALYLQRGESGRETALTDSSVAVNNFSVTKYENPGGPAVIQIDLTLRYNSENPQNQIARTAKTAFTRISAATFDSSVIPNASNNWDIGDQNTRWRNGYFSGNVSVSGYAGFGTDPSVTARIKSNGDIGFSAQGAGIIFKANDGCWLLSLTDKGAFSTSSATCP